VSDQRIFKYDVGKEPLAYYSVILPKGARVLYAAEQNDSVRVWALIDSKERVQQGHIYFIAGTGIDVPFSPVIVHGRVTRGPFVWHILEWDFRDPQAWYLGADTGIVAMARQFKEQDGPEFGPPATTKVEIPEQAITIALVMWFGNQTWYTEMSQTKVEEYRKKMRTLLEFGASCASGLTHFTDWGPNVH
jgi:hypothetical protein